MLISFTVSLFLILTLVSQIGHSFPARADGQEDCVTSCTSEFVDRCANIGRLCVLKPNPDYPTCLNAHCVGPAILNNAAAAQQPEVTDSYNRQPS
ncbi:hypothetical protein HDU99_004567, partial [Rhizoclosmatium hyalinum]